MGPVKERADVLSASTHVHVAPLRPSLTRFDCISPNFLSRSFYKSSATPLQNVSIVEMIFLNPRAETIQTSLDDFASQKTRSISTPLTATAYKHLSGARRWLDDLSTHSPSSCDTVRPHGRRSRPLGHYPPNHGPANSRMSRFLPGQDLLQPIPDAFPSGFYTRCTRCHG